MLNKIKINFLDLYRSKWKFIFFVPICLFYGYLFFNFGFFKAFNFGSWNRNFHFGDILTMGLCFFVGVYSIQSLDDMDLTLPLSREKTILAIYFSNLLFVGIYLAVTFIFLFISALFLGYSLGYIFNVIFNVIFIDILAFNFSLVLGMLVGRLIKYKLAYLFVLIPVLFFTPLFSMRFLFIIFPEKMDFWKGLSFLEDNVQFTFFTSLGNVYDRVYFFDKAIPFVFAILLLAILLATFASKKGIHFVSIVFLLALSSFVLTKSADVNYEEYSSVYSLSTMEKREAFLEDYNSDVEVISYKMDIALGENFKNICEIELVNNGEDLIEDFSMAFSSNLYIDELLLDGKDFSYSRDGESLLFKGILLEPGEKKKLFISYGGTLKDLLNPGILLNYSSKSSSNLLPAMNWYPIIKTNSEVDFDLQISYNNKLITNLNDFEILDSGSSHISGRSKYLYLSDGYYAETDRDGVRYVSSEEIIKNYLADYDKTIEYCIENGLARENPRQIVIFPSGHGDYFELDDSLMLSEY